MQVLILSHSCAVVSSVHFSLNAHACSIRHEEKQTAEFIDMQMKTLRGPIADDFEQFGWDIRSAANGCVAWQSNSEDGCLWLEGFQNSQLFIWTISVTRSDDIDQVDSSIV